MIKVTIYNEYMHERNNAKVREVYPDGMHMTIKRFLESDEISVRTFILDNVAEITDEVLKDTDVLIWWGHGHHKEVPDEVAERVQMAVLGGMGAIFLHSAHHSKPFKRLMGTTCNLNWREDGDFERVYAVKPNHPIARGLDKRYIYLPGEECYGEPFDVPEPDETVFIGGYQYGDVFRSGLCYYRGNGRIFYFQPGHESFPTYKIPEVQTVIRNAVYWARRTTYQGIDVVHSVIPNP